MRRSRNEPVVEVRRRRRWPRRLVVLAVLVAGAFAYRGRKLEEAERRYQAPTRHA